LLHSKDGLKLLNKPPNITRPAKRVIKIANYSAGGVAIGVLGVHLQNFPVNNG